MPGPAPSVVDVNSRGTLFAAMRFRWRHVYAGSLLIMIAGNLASLLTADALWFGTWRFVAGFGAGGLVSLSFVVVGLTRNPDRNFGWLIMWVLAYGAVVLLAMPTACQMLGLANGPWIAARVINEDGFANVLWLGIGLFALSLVLILAPLLTHHAMGQPPVPAG